MGATKTDHFTDKHNQLAILAKALGHPARIAIMEYLLKTNACICGDIVNELPLAQPTVSQHLKELKNAGLIKGSIEGRAVCYCINDKALQKLQAWFADIAAKIALKRTKCCFYFGFFLILLASLLFLKLTLFISLFLCLVYLINKERK